MAAPAPQKSQVTLAFTPAGTARRLARSLRRYARPGTARSVRGEVKRRVACAVASEGPSD